MPHAELCALVPTSPARLALELTLDEAARAGVVDVAAIEADGAERDAAALAVLRAVALEGRFVDAPEQARRAFHDVASRLRDARDREERHQRRRGWESRTISATELLEQAQRGLDSRRGRSKQMRRPHGGVAN
jgi:hypothetical protein